MQREIHFHAYGWTLLSEQNVIFLIKHLRSIFNKSLEDVLNTCPPINKENSPLKSPENTPIIDISLINRLCVQKGWFFYRADLTWRASWTLSVLFFSAPQRSMSCPVGCFSRITYLTKLVTIHSYTV